MGGGHRGALEGRELTGTPRDGSGAGSGGGRADADRAVAAARTAFPAWRGMHFKDRQKALLRIADALEANAEELSRLTAADTGNALRTQARPESQGLVGLFRYFGGVAGEFKGTVLPAGDDQLQYTRREPLGVVVGILPWNSPLMIAGMKTPAALAAGNTLILKPLRRTAHDSRMAEIRRSSCRRRANVVTGNGRRWRGPGSSGRRQSVVHGIDHSRPARAEVRANGWPTCRSNSAARARPSCFRTRRRQRRLTPRLTVC